MKDIDGAQVLRIVHINSKTIGVIIHTYSNITYTDLDNNPVNTVREFAEEEEWLVQTVKEGNQLKIQEISEVPTKVI